MTRKARIAHLAGPNATIQNTPSFVTSNLEQGEGQARPGSSDEARRHARAVRRAAHFAGAPEAKARQGFFPDGSHSFEEIDRLQIGNKGTGNLISAKAEIEAAGRIGEVRLAVRAMGPDGIRGGGPRHRQLGICRLTESAMG